MTAEEIFAVLAGKGNLADEELFAEARVVKARCGKTEVLPRGLIECSNVCAKDCRYCGIRKGNGKVRRYRLAEDEAVRCIEETRRRGYPAVAFQAGEIESDENTRYYERLLGHCRGLEVTLSLGEQDESVYRRWKEAGALRYLLRIETSNRVLYAKLHPAGCSFDRRLACLKTLKRLGYVTGTGVMIGLPGQTPEDLVKDILFFRDIQADMVGMGPYIPHADTPLAAEAAPLDAERRAWLMTLSLRMIALARIVLQDVNIVAATALEVLDPQNGRARGIAAGANVIMPNVSPCEHRRDYGLYPGKAEA